MAKARRVAASRGKPAKTKKPTQKELFEECLRSAQDLVDKMIADADLGLVKAEADVVARITGEFESQSEIARDGKPVPLSEELKELLTLLVRAGRSVDLCNERNSLRALYWKGFIAKTTKDSLKELHLTKGFRGFLDWVGWKKTSAHTWINLFREFGTHLFMMPPGSSQNKLEEIYKARGMQSLDWTSKHLEEIAQAPNVEAVQKLLGTFKERTPKSLSRNWRHSNGFERGDRPDGRPGDEGIPRQFRRDPRYQPCR